MSERRMVNHKMCSNELSPTLSLRKYLQTCAIGPHRDGARLQADNKHNIYYVSFPR